MAKHEDIQRIKDSTIQKLMSIVENHNQNYRDQEVTALNEEIGKIQKEIEMIEKIIKVKEDSNQELTNKFLQIRLHCDIHVKTKEHQLRRLKTFADEGALELEQSKMYYRHALDDWTKKEERYMRDIKKMEVYIDSLHATLERSGIFRDRMMEEPDEYESEIDSNNQLYDSEQSESDAQFADDDDDFDESDYQKNMQYEQSQALVEQPDDKESFEDDEQHFESGHDASQAELNGEATSQQEEVQSSELVQDNQHAEESVKSLDELKTSDKLMPLEEFTQTDHCSFIETDPQELSWCDMIEAEDSELDQQSQMIETVHADSLVSELTCKNEDEMTQKASSDSNAENRDKVLETEKPIEAEEPQKMKMDPLVNGYDQVERKKPKSKPKKQRKQKPKSKPKFSNLVSFGGY